ncbi:50S ribosomal protein L11 methyltransferase [Parasporobacterium paucivorans]|uniref:Ribosomal protein L11 methyltransferase n=1 Tax=Parasporobacterium paucivorans DSM 15970 TaxID=1122934 RepID=A0A1M6JJS6_9FIRM|nr:50S ribosomal protein L11 methyltransferase [Parasporobacterium paucivorans]SHJ46991.1 ribosomal protein L11 methyltransferase [Parasporobacterium paucivorans DSM 15970]
MKNTGWTDITFEVDINDAKSAEAIAAQCTGLGIFVEDYSDIEAVQALVGGDYIDEKLMAKDKSCVTIHIYIPSDEHPEETVTRVSELMTQAGVKFRQSYVQVMEDDWENDWKRHHKPQRIGNRLIICPSWEECAMAEGEVKLTIDPGSSFGTGKDDTTKLCLRLMESKLSTGDKVLDMGCGSGVLAIAALLLGAQSAVGVDIEENAVRDAIENARINGVGDRFEGRWGNVLSDEVLKDSIGSGYDLICANIVADVHLAMKGMYFDKLKENGRLIVSGIISARKHEVQSAIELSGFALTGMEEENGWTALGFKKTDRSN